VKLTKTALELSSCILPFLLLSEGKIGMEQAKVLLQMFFFSIFIVHPFVYMANTFAYFSFISDAIWYWSQMKNPSIKGFFQLFLLLCCIWNQNKQLILCWRTQCLFSREISFITQFHYLKRTKWNWNKREDSHSPRQNETASCNEKKTWPNEKKTSNRDGFLRQAHKFILMQIAAQLSDGFDWTPDS
jgi:hypothetical protein